MNRKNMRFAISAYTNNPKKNRWQHYAAVVVSVSKLEAYGFAMQELVKKYPLEEGWVQHSIAIVKINETKF